MEKINASIFDFFSYLIPGILYSLTLYCVLWFKGNDCISIKDVVQAAASLQNNFTYFIGIILSYIFGYISSIIGSYLFWLYSYVFFKKKQLNTKYRKGELYILAREFSPANFDSINKWDSLFIFSHNIALAIVFNLGFLTVAFSCVNKLILIFPLLLFVILYKQADLYRTWRNNNLDNLARLFNLHEESRIMFKQKISK